MIKQYYFYVLKNGMHYAIGVTNDKTNTVCLHVMWPDNISISYSA